VYKIIVKERIGPLIHKMTIKAPRIARNALPGQFIIVMPYKKGERIPLTIYDKDINKGTLTVIFQAAGKTTCALSRLKANDDLLNVAGPLGRPTMVGKAGRMILIGGGIGIAEVIPIARHAKEIGNDITIIAGARSREQFVFEDELSKLTGKLIITTDDGSYGEKGLVTGPLKRLLKDKRFELAYCVGPDVMMQAVCRVTKEFGLKTIVSLDANMVDATGMCGTCRVMVAGRTRFSCVDGPEFDGHEVDFAEFMARQKRFEKEEKLSMKGFKEACCVRR
jgi:ferredoxin--NADP+ reductase